jgi:hypothetical protein
LKGVLPSKRWLELELSGVYWNLYHAKEALKNKEYISGMVFINLASMAFTVKMKELEHGLNPLETETNNPLEIEN